MDANFINQRTKKNYDLIAQHFSKKRTIDKGWFDWILPYVKNNSKVIDLGCGNGRLYGFLKQKFNNINYIGIDFSENLIKIAKENYPKTTFKVQDISKKSTYESFKNIDVVFSFRTLHHIPDKPAHEKIFRNCHKILKKDGYFILEVWNMWQKRFWWQHVKQLSLKTLYVPYQAGKIKVNRFHYCFTKKELENLALKTGFKIIESGAKDNLQNIYLVCEKN